MILLSPVQRKAKGQGIQFPTDLKIRKYGMLTDWVLKKFCISVWKCHNISKRRSGDGSAAVEKSQKRISLYCFLLC